MDNSNRTFVSSVLFLDIVEYSKQSVTDQLALKQQFNTLLVDALKHVAQSDRIVLDTGDGAAISFQGNPEDSLFAAMHLRDAIEALPTTHQPQLAVRFGINLGPVRLIKDINGQVNIIGDGINVAQRVMSFAEPGAILVSRSYYEVVSRLSDDYAKIFSAAGTRTDKHVREHAVYEIGHSTASLAEQHHAKPAQNAGTTGDDAGTHQAAAAKKSGTDKKFLIGTALGVIALLGAAATALLPGRASPDVQAAAPAPSEPPKKKIAQPSLAATATTAATTMKTTAPDAKTTATKAPPPMAAAKVTVALSIKPWGEVYVDGKLKGISPPLKSLTLAQGKHVVEIRNTTFPASVNTITLKAGDTPRIEHKF